MKLNSTHIMGIQEGEKSGQGIEHISEEIMTKNFPNLVKEKDTQVQEAQRVSRGTQKGPHQGTS